MGPAGTCVLGEKVTRTSAVQAEHVANVLPFTGGNVSGLIATGTLGLGAGALLLLVAGRRGRRTTT